MDVVGCENAIYSACYRTIAIDKADAYLHICDGVNVDGPPETGEPPTIEDYCPYALCQQQLNICAGYKNLALADSVGAVEIETTPLAMLLPVMYSRGVVLVNHDYDSGLPGEPAMRFDLWPALQGSAAGARRPNAPLRSRDGVLPQGRSHEWGGARGWLHETREHPGGSVG